MTEEQHIEELLIEADAYGLRLEVLDWAKKELEDNPKLRRVEAYELAFKEWVK